MADTAPVAEATKTAKYDIQNPTKHPVTIHDGINHDKVGPGLPQKQNSYSILPGKKLLGVVLADHVAERMMGRKGDLQIVLSGKALPPLKNAAPDEKPKTDKTDDE